jgi:ABC-2 type transport system permease protein
MIADVLTVMWKESQGLIRYQGSLTKTMLSLLIPVVMMGIYLPLQIGRALIEGPWSLLVSVFVPMMMVGMTIPESFAGERERHTLGTLLASRLADRSILFGKVAMSVSYALVITLALHLVSLVVVNIARWDGRIVLYTPIVALANLALSLLMAGLVANLGVLISIRAVTVQGAQQTLMSVTLYPIVFLQLIPLILLNIVPDGKAYLRVLVAAADPTQVILVVIAVLLVLDLGLIIAAQARFKRAQLILV